MAICKNCGTEVKAGAKFCAVCGQRQEEVYQAPPAAEPQTAWQQPAAAPIPPQGQYQQYQQPEQPQYQQQQYQQYQQYQQPVYPGKPPICSITEIYRRALAVLSKKPIRLWGLSLMHSLLSTLASLLCVLPIISIPVTLTLEVGMTNVYMDGYKGKEVNSDQLFMGFKSFGRFAGGMAWRMLWTFIWALVPIAGFVMAVIKGYAYRFVPYILLTDPEISATEALRKSMSMTQGYKGKMFGAEILLYAIIFVACLILGLLCAIPYIGILFIIITVIVAIALVIFLPLLMGLIQAAFYEEISKVSDK